MPRRVYICDNCGHSFELYQPIHEPLKKQCPCCKKHKLYQDLTGQYVSVKNYSTAGSIAEKNSKKLGKTKLEEIEAKEKNNNQKMIEAKHKKLEDAGLKVLKPNSKEIIRMSDENYKKIVPNGKFNSDKAIKYIQTGKV